jgi:hypothetical protein
MYLDITLHRILECLLAISFGKQRIGQVEECHRNILFDPGLELGLPELLLDLIHIDDVL